MVVKEVGFYSMDSATLSEMRRDVHGSLNEQSRGCTFIWEQNVEIEGKNTCSSLRH